MSLKRYQSINWRYWLRLLGLFAFALAAALILLPVLFGFLLTYGLLHAPCQTNRQTPGDYGYAWEDVTLPARAGGRFRGYFISGSNGATILIPPTLAQGRDGRLREAALLAEHEFAVFTFEARPCAGMRPLSLGYQEVDEVADALDYLLSRRDVDPERIGIYGFSSAGATAIMAAARLPTLRAVVAEGGYGDFAEGALGLNDEPEHLLLAYFWPLYGVSTRLTYRWVAGSDIDQLSPLDVIDQIAPRPILLIYGDQELSLIGGRQQQAAAGNNAELWVVPGAGHGTYLDAAPQEYERRLTTFFERVLLIANSL